MINHFYTLFQVVEDLKLKLQNAIIVECFTQEKDEIIIVLDNGEDLYNLCINLSANDQAIYIKDKFARARSNSYDLFKEIIGDTLRNIDIANNDRTVFFRLNLKTIVVNLASGSEHNFIILNKEHIIENAFNNSKILKFQKFEKKENILPEAKVENFKTIGKLLCNSRILLPKLSAIELLSRYSFDFNQEIKDISNLEEIKSEAIDLRENSLKSKKYYLYLYEENTALLSLLEITNSSHKNLIIFDDIHSAISRRVAYRKKSEYIKENKASILKKLSVIKNKLIKNIELCKNTKVLEERVELYKNYADILLSLPNSNKNNGNEIKTNDWYGNELVIPLDNKLNLIENSTKYYNKIKKLKSDINKKNLMLPKYQKKYIEINNIISEIENLNSIKEIKKYMNSSKTDDKRINKAINENESTKFREFSLGEGYTLFVGRNSQNNDELTMKFAKPNDIWMHARGSSGSHTVLRGLAQKETKPPKNILNIAAGITAYYSKQKNAKYVPVAYTYKKYVHKPKGANPGAVTMSKETVIMVEPKLPQENE
mgnify:CR=1 FL=1